MGHIIHCGGVLLYTPLTKLFDTLFQMVWIETPTNPLLKLVDIQGAAEIVHQHEVNLSSRGNKNQLRMNTCL